MLRGGVYKSKRVWCTAGKEGMYVVYLDIRRRQWNVVKPGHQYPSLKGREEHAQNMEMRHTRVVSSQRKTPGTHSI
jgi:hypothetical protein